MADIYELKQRALDLENATESNSVPPSEVGRLHFDTLDYISGLELNNAPLGIKKVYRTEAEMRSDTTLLDDFQHKPLKAGMLVIVSNEGDTNNGDVYRYNEPESPNGQAWTFISRLSSGSVVNNPDDEDLTQVDNKLKIANRAYDPVGFSGMGYEILRKNIRQFPKYPVLETVDKTADGTGRSTDAAPSGQKLSFHISENGKGFVTVEGSPSTRYSKWAAFGDVKADSEYLVGNDALRTDRYFKVGDSYFTWDGKALASAPAPETKPINLLTQDMVSKHKTRYVIRYDFDLNGETLEVPEGCCLLFEGGSLNDGSLSGNNTRIQADTPDQIFSDMDFSGTFINDKVFVDWFGAIEDPGDKSTDVTPFCLAAFKLVLCSNGKNLCFMRKTYNINTPLDFKSVSGSLFNIYGIGTKTHLSFAGGMDFVMSGNFSKLCKLRISFKSNDVWSGEPGGKGSLFRSCVFQNNESDPSIQNCVIGGAGVLFDHCSFSGRSVIYNCILGPATQYFFVDSMFGDGGISCCYIHGANGGASYGDSKGKQPVRFSKGTQFTMFDLSNSWIEFVDMGGDGGYTYSSRTVNCYYDYCCNISFKAVACHIYHFDYSTIKSNILHFSPAATLAIERVAIFSTDCVLSCMFEGDMDANTYLFKGRYDATRSSLDGFVIRGCGNMSSAANPENVCLYHAEGKPYYGIPGAISRMELPFRLTKVFTPLASGMEAYISPYERAISKVVGVPGDTFQYWTVGNDESRILGYKLVDTFQSGLLLYDGPNNLWAVQTIAKGYTFGQGKYIWAFDVRSSKGAGGLNLIIGIKKDLFHHAEFTTPQTGDLYVKVGTGGGRRAVMVSVRIYKFTGDVNDVGSMKDNFIGATTKGPTRHRPELGNEAMAYFDTDLKKAVWWTGEEWVDGTGSPA